MKREQLTVVLNREAGTLAALGADQVEAGLREIFTTLGCGVHIFNVPGAEVEDTLREALQSTADAVIVGGGDGTVAAAATIFAGQEEYHGSWFLNTARTLIDAMRSMATFPPLDLSLNQHGSTASHRTRMAMIANHDHEEMFGLIPARSSHDGWRGGQSGPAFKSDPATQGPAHHLAAHRGGNLHSSLEPCA